jgi:hypothetical protein
MFKDIFEFSYFRRYLHLPKREILWHVLLACSAIVCVIAANNVLKKVFKQRNYRSMSYAALSDQTQAILLGTCHLYNGVHPDYTGVKSVNLAATNLSFDRMRKVYEASKERAPNVKYVLVELDIGTLLGNPYQAEGGVSPESLAELGVKYPWQFPKNARSLTEFIHQTLSGVFSWRLVPIEFQNRNAAPPTTNESEVSFAGFVASEAIIYEGMDYKDMFAKATSYFQLNMLAENKAELYKLIDEITASGATPIFIQYPHYIEFTKSRPASWDKAFERTIVELKNYVGKENFIFWDYNSWNATDKKLFRDIDHLNTRGALHFSAELGGRIKSLLN